MEKKHWTQRTPKSIRFSHEQEEYFLKIRKILVQRIGKPISISWIIKKMMSFGQEEFHREMKISFDTLEKVEVTEEDIEKTFKRIV